MISVFFGNDTTQVRKKTFDFLHTLSDANDEVTHVTSEKYHEGILKDLAQGASLFGGTQVCVIDTLSEDAVCFDSFLGMLPFMSESQNHFVVIETSLNAADKKKIQSHAEKFEEFTGEKKERFNAFSMTDAFLRRDKKSLWLLLQEAWKEGLSNEEIIGVLFWQVKILRLAERTKSAEEAGQKPFVYQKAKRALSAFKKGELDQISLKLITMYHEGHMGKRDVSLALEKWVLTL